MPEARGKTIQVRVSDAEKAQIQERAVAAGKKVSDYVRDRALGRRQRSSPPGSSIEEAKPELPPAKVVVVGPPGTVRKATAADVDGEIIAAEVDEAKMEDEAAEEAFIERRTRQLVGQGRTTIVARREAKAEWRMRAS